MKYGMMMTAGTVMAAAATTASAAITGVTGSTTWLGTPPLNCTQGMLTGPNAYAWDEQQNVFSTGVFCDMVNNPGTSAGAIPGLLTGAFDSHFISYEDYTGLPAASGTVTFSNQIIGVIFVNTSLDNTDVLFGSGGTVYPNGYGTRGLNLTSSFSILGNTLKFNLATITPVLEVVQIRVLTAPVPTPGGAAVLGLAGLAACRRKRAS